MNELALFAGAGGGILASELLGFRTVCAVECDAYAAQILAQRQNDRILPAFPIWSDVRSFDGKPWRGIVELVSGGFPCQDISAAGRGEGISGVKSGLWGSMFRVVCDVRPRLVFVENSPMLTSRGLGVVLGDLASIGFDCEWLCLSAEELGAPHKRDRIWILAYSNGDERAMANTDSMWKLQQERDQQKQRRRPSNSSQDLADPNGPRLEGHNSSIGEQEKPWPWLHGSWWRNDPAGFPESQLGRVANGVAHRVDRLKATGNGQVSIVAATAFVELYNRFDQRRKTQ